MKKIATVIPLLAVLFAATLVPSAAAEHSTARADVPAACAGLVTQLTDTLKKVIGSVTALPPDPTAAAAPLGDILGLLTALQGAKCLPTPPISAPVPLPVGELQYQGPEACLSVVMGLFGTVFSLLGQVVPGAGVPDITKLLGAVTGLLKTLTDALSACGLPVPAGGVPTLPLPVPGLPGLPA